MSGAGRGLSDRMEAALARAVERREPAELFDLLERGSALPGPRANLELAREVGAAIARRVGRADPLLRAMIDARSEFVVVVAALALAERWVAGIDSRGASVTLQAMTEDERRHVRAAVVEALRVVIAARGGAGVEELAAWTDGYLQAHTVLAALGERAVLSGLGEAEPVLARLDEAFALADGSPRAAERSQGVRALRRGLPEQIARFAARWPETVDWLMARTSSTRPETRAVVADAIAALRKGSLSDAEAAKLDAALRGTAPAPRDPTRIVHGTRKRSRGRRA